MTSLLLGQVYTPPVTPGVDYNLLAAQVPGSEILPAGVTYARSGAQQARTDHLGAYAITPADEAPWHYVGGALRGILFRQAQRPLINTLDHDNLNPTDLSGMEQTSATRVKVPLPGWPAFITAVHGWDATSTSDNQDMTPPAPLGAGNPGTAVGWCNIGAVPSNTPQMRYWDAAVIADIAPLVNTAVFFTGQNAGAANTSSRVRFSNRVPTAEYQVNQLQFAGLCFYAGTLTLDQFDIAWEGKTLNAGDLTFDIPDGVYNIGELTLGYDDGLEATNTVQITVTGGVYQVNLADFGLADVETIWRFASTGAPGPQPTEETFDLRAGLVPGVLYSQPYAQIKRDVTGLAFLAAVNDGRECYSFSGEPLGMILEKTHTNKLEHPNVSPLGGGETTADDSAHLATDPWGPVVPGGLVWDVQAEFLSPALGNTNLHSVTCLMRRPGPATPDPSSDLAHYPSYNPSSAVTEEVYRTKNLYGFTPGAPTDQVVLRNQGEGLYAVLWTIVEDLEAPWLPIYDTTGSSSAGGQKITIEQAAYIPGNYDVTITTYTNAVATLRNQALSGDVSFSADKLDVPATFDFADFGLTRGQKTIRQIAFTLPAPDPGPGPGPGPSPGQVEKPWGLMIRGREDVVDTLNDDNTWDLINRYPGTVKFMMHFIYWNRVENQTEGVYDFSYLEQLADKAEQYGVRLFLHLQAHSFSSVTGKFDPSLCAPAWMVNPTPANFARFGGFNYPGYFIDGGTNGYKARRWDNNYMDALERYMADVTDFCSRDSRFIGVISQESSVGRFWDNNQGGLPEPAGSPEVRAAGKNFVDRLIQAMNSCCARRTTSFVNFWQNLNFLDATGYDPQGEIERVYNAIVAQQAGMVVNDPSVPSPGSFNGSNFVMYAEEVAGNAQGCMMMAKGEQYNGVSSAREWYQLNGKSGASWTHNQYMRYNCGGPSALPNSLIASVHGIPHWMPSGPSDQDDLWDWFINPSEDAAFWNDYYTRDNELVDIP